MFLLLCWPVYLGVFLLLLVAAALALVVEVFLAWGGHEVVCDFVYSLLLFDDCEPPAVKVVKVAVMVAGMMHSCLKMHSMDEQLVQNSRSQGSEGHLLWGPRAYSLHAVEPLVGWDLYFQRMKAQISRLLSPRNQYIVGDARLLHVEVGCH